MAPKAHTHSRPPFLDSSHTGGGSGLLDDLALRPSAREHSTSSHAGLESLIADEPMDW